MKGARTGEGDTGFKREDRVLPDKDAGACELLVKCYFNFFFITKSKFILLNVTNFL